MTGKAAGMKIRVWDLPTRLFHWLLVGAIAGAWFTGKTGGNWLIWHGRLGLVIVGLVVFRLAWGLCGPTYARFSTFFPTPARLKAYLSGQWRGLGHNPLGALSVFALLGLVSLQATTGLFSYNDDVAYEGHLYSLVVGSVSEQFTQLHHQIFDVLLLLVALHIGAIAFYLLIKKDNLVKPMVTGEKAIESGEPTRGGSVTAFLAAALAALALAWVASGAWVSQPPPPPASAAPAW